MAACRGSSRSSVRRSRTTPSTWAMARGRSTSCSHSTSRVWGSASGARSPAWRSGARGAGARGRRTSRRACSDRGRCRCGSVRAAQLLAIRMAEAGASILMVTLPAGGPMTPAEVVAYYASVDAAARLPRGVPPLLQPAAAGTGSSARERRTHSSMFKRSCSAERGSSARTACDGPASRPTRCWLGRSTSPCRAWTQ